MLKNLFDKIKNFELRLIHGYSAIVTLVILVLVYFLYKCYFGATAGQRVSTMIPNLNPPSKMIVLIANSVMDSKKLFSTKKMDKNFVSVFTDEERMKVKQEATAFFKDHYGLSDSFLNTFMTELAVNPKANYTNMDSGKRIKDGGYVVMVIKGTKLYGKYGGTSGVASNKNVVLPFGYYMFNDTKVRYKGTCPMVTFDSYDASYTPISCKIEMNGLTGMAEGIYIKTKLKNGLDHVLIKNVLTFN